MKDETIKYDGKEWETFKSFVKKNVEKRYTPEISTVNYLDAITRISELTLSFNVMYGLDVEVIIKPKECSSSNPEKRLCGLIEEEQNK